MVNFPKQRLRVLDPRLRPLAAVLNLANQKIRQPGALKVSKVHPLSKAALKNDWPREKYGPLPPNIGSLLKAAGFPATITPGSVVAVPSPKKLRSQFRAARLVFWHLSSLYYPAALAARRTKTEILSVLNEYGFPVAYYDFSREALKFLGYVVGQTGRNGGLELLPPAKLATELLPSATDGHQVTSLTRRPGPQNKTNRIPARERLRREQDLYNTPAAPLLHFFCQIYPAPNNRDFSNWRARSESTYSNRRGKAHFPEYGDLQNPDIVGYRYNGPRLAGNPASNLEILAVEVKRENLSRAAIAQAVAYTEFAHIVYLALPFEISEVVGRSGLMSSLQKQGLGLILLKNRYQLDSWHEAIPPRFHSPRPARLLEAIKDFFPDKVKKAPKARDVVARFRLGG